MDRTYTTPRAALDVVPQQPPLTLAPIETAVPPEAEEAGHA